MNKKITKAVSIGLCAATLVPSFAFAKQFKDVTANGPYGWAYNYIDVLSDKGIIYGYTDGNFRPKNSVSFEEVLQLLKGIMNPSTSDISNAVKKHSDLMDKYKVALWAREAVGVALERKVIDEKLLSEALDTKLIGVDTSKQKYPTRSTIAVLYARALQLSPNGDESLLKHADKNNISSTVRGYLASLVKAKVFSATGGDGDKFDGERDITRAEIATITKLAYDYKNSVKETKTATGKVIFAEHIGNKDVIVLEAGNVRTSYTVDSSTSFKMDGKIVTFKDVKAGQEAKITYTASTDDSAGLATIVEITNSEKSLIGYVDVAYIPGGKISIDYTDNNDKLDQTGITKFSTTKRDSFEFASTAKIYRLGKLINQSELTYGDMVEFKTDSTGKIVELFSYPRTASTTVTVKDIIPATVVGQRDKLIVTVDNKELTLYADPYDANDPYRTRSSVYGVRKGDKVTLDTQYKVIVKSNTIVQSGNISGYVTNINSSWYSGEYTLTVNNREYRVNKDTTIDGKVVTYSRQFEYLKDNYVNISYNGDLIKNIQIINPERHIVYGRFHSIVQLNVGNKIYYYPETTDGVISKELKDVIVSENYIPKEGDRITLTGMVDSNGNFINGTARLVY